MFGKSIFVVAGLALALGWSSEQLCTSLIPFSDKDVVVVNEANNPVPVTGSLEVTTTAPLSVQAAAPVPITTSSPLTVSVSGVPAVKDADNAARQFVRVESTFTIPNDFISVGSEVYTVPAGKRLVIEHFGLRASAFGTLVPGINAVADIVIKASDNITRLATVPQDVTGRTMSAFRRWFASEPVTIYADEGERVRIEVEFTGSVPGAASPTVVIMGHLVDKN